MIVRHYDIRVRAECVHCLGCWRLFLAPSHWSRHRCRLRHIAVAALITAGVTLWLFFAYHAVWMVLIGGPD
jgi:hypothetical protein